MLSTEGSGDHLCFLSLDGFSEGRDGADASTVDAVVWALGPQRDGG